MADPQPAKHETVFDTSLQHLGTVYAKALLGVAQSSGRMDGVLEELGSFCAAVDQLPDLRAVLESPRVAFPEKERLLNKIASGSSDEFQRFLKVLTRKGRFACLPAVQSSAREMFNEMTGKVEATVTTASEIDDEARLAITAKLSEYLKADVVLDCRIDPDIIGGIVVRVGDTVFDSSVANELKRVRDKAVQRTSQEIRQSLSRFAQ